MLPTSSRSAFRCWPRNGERGPSARVCFPSRVAIEERNKLISCSANFPLRRNDKRLAIFARQQCVGVRIICERLTVAVELERRAENKRRLFQIDFVICQVLQRAVEGFQNVLVYFYPAQLS